MTVTVHVTPEQLTELIALDATEPHRAPALDRGRLATPDARIAEMTRAHEPLARLARRACGSGVEGPCPILTAFDEGCVGLPAECSLISERRAAPALDMDGAEISMHREV